MHPKDDLHIAILKYGRENAESGVMFNDLDQHIQKKGYNVSQARLSAYFGETYEPMDRDRRGGSYDDRAKEKCALTIESTFRLIEYEEFRSANRSAFWATVFAISAIVISIFSTCVSIHYSKMQIALQIQQNGSSETKTEQPANK